MYSPLTTAAAKMGNWRLEQPRLKGRDTGEEGPAIMIRDPVNWQWPFFRAFFKVMIPRRGVVRSGARCLPIAPLEATVHLGVKRL